MCYKNSKPKEEGGLGLRNLLEANRVSCLKLIGRILTARSSLWVQWIWKYLIRKGSFWSVKEKSSLGSWMWKKLLQLRPLALQLTKVEINSGSTTSFWFERWSQLGKLIELTGERGCLMLGIPINSTVERVVQTYRARDHRDPVSRQIEQEIMALRNRGLNQMEDVCLWKRETGYYKEGFFTSQTWELIRIKSPRVMWHKGIWFQEGTPKFSFITWLAVHDRLATGDRILRWNPRAISSCWLCNSATESRDHLFFECLYSREVWYGTIGDLAGNRSLHRWSQIIQFLANGLHERNLTLLLRYSFQVVLYAVWHERNVRRVGETSQPAACLIARLDKLVRNRITSLRRKNGRKYEKTMEVWFGRR